MANKRGEIVFFANYYSSECKGFYFKTLDELREKAAKVEERTGCEEYEIEFIDGPTGSEKLWTAVLSTDTRVFDALETFLDKVVGLNAHDQAALYWILDQYGERDLDIALDKVDNEVRLFEGTVKDYAYELVDDIGIEGISNPEAYFDYEAFGRDAKMDLDADSEDDAAAFDMDDAEYGEQLVDDQGFANLGKDALSTYFDYDKFARDLELGGDVDEIEFAGTTWVVTNPHL